MRGRKRSRGRRTYSAKSVSVSHAGATVKGANIVVIDKQKHMQQTLHKDRERGREKGRAEREGERDKENARKFTSRLTERRMRQATS